MRQFRGLWVWGFSHLGKAVLAAALVAVAILGTGVAQAEPSGYRPPEIPTQPGPPQTDHLGAARYLKTNDNVVPLGTNNFGCKPTAAHPRPVVLAHGTDSSAYSDYSAIAPQLAAAGFCVFALNYGGTPGAESYGTEDVVLSSHQIGAFVDQVLAATGASQVDLVGFSQGATVTRFYVNKLGGAPKVGQWVGLASPSYGGVMYGLVPVVDAVPGGMMAFARVTSLAAVQQAQGSAVMLELNAGGDTVPGPKYTTIGSKVDEMIQPNSNIALRGPGAVNISLQDRCAIDLTGHFHMVYDPFVQQLLLNVLDPSTPAPVCSPVMLGTGIPEVIIAGNS
ncbi:esterase/lipase family protein [Nocardia suismassiliense]|uniref:esterase/lipase family protein n=1 Tax=Nocardia suismassiliense TaxID=2077092 RepID=UPI000D1DDC1C